jgi:hypothetical protein
MMTYANSLRDKLLRSAERVHPKKVMGHAALRSDLRSQNS